MVILVAGGGHNTLNVGTEGADFVPFFYNYGVNTVILRNRLRQDGYNPQTDAVYDAQQAIRMVRAHAQGMEHRSAQDRDRRLFRRRRARGAGGGAFDDVRQGEQRAGRSAGGHQLAPGLRRAGLSGADAVRARRRDRRSRERAADIHRLRRDRATRVHAIWADEYFAALLKAQRPNLEMHIYGNGVHANGLKDRDGEPFGTWQERFIDWFRDLGFLQAGRGDEGRSRRRGACHAGGEVSQANAFIRSQRP